MSDVGRHRGSVRRRGRRPRGVAGAERAPDGAAMRSGDGSTSVLEVRRVRHRHVVVGHALERRVELVERLAHDERDHLGAEAGERPALLDDDAARCVRAHATRASPPRRAAQRAQIDDLGLDALLGERLGRLERRRAPSSTHVIERDVACPARFTSATPSGTTCSPVGDLALQR